MTKNLTLIMTIVGTLLIGSYFISCAQSQSVPISAQDQNVQQSWTSDRWTADDTALNNIRGSIDELLREKELTSHVIEAYASEYAADKNCQSLFRWAYASFYASQQHPSILQHSEVGAGAFQQTTEPNSYEFDRIRFLVTAHYTHPTYLQQLGERLLQKHPNDIEVEYYLAECYEPSKSLDQRRKAIALSERMIQQEPTRPNPYSVLGGIYFSYWMVHQDSEDGNNAISAYQKYLQRTTPSDPWRTNAQRIISYIQARLR